METTFNTEIGMLIATYIILGFAGIMLNAYFAVATTPHTGNFKFNVWWKLNKNSIMISAVGILLIVPLVTIVPDVAQTVKSVLGLDLGSTPMAQVTFGFLLYHLIRNSTKKPK